MNRVTNIDLSNVKKCNQVWESMPEHEQGRLCLKCKNKIIDFRELPRENIAEIHAFSEHTVCGLYSTEQLKTPKESYKHNPFKTWNRFYLGLLSLLTFNSFGQEHKREIKIEQTEPMKTDSVVQNKQDFIVVNQGDSLGFISGVISDSKGEPIAYANVIIKGTQVGCTTNQYGYYKIRFTKAMNSLQVITLKSAFVGYESEEKIVNLESLKFREDKMINMQLKEGEVTYYYVLPKYPLHKRIWFGIKMLFTKK